MAEIVEIGFRADTDDLEFANRQIRALRPSAEGAERAADNLNDELNRTNSVFGNIARGGNIANGVFGRLTSGVKSLASGLTGIATGVIAGFAFSSMIDGARELSASIAELSTLLPVGSAELDKMQMAAREMADEFGTSAAFQVKAFYGAVSAGASDAASAIKIVDTANKLAIGGITDVTVGVDILTTAVNAYAASGLEANDASDALFVGMRAGKTTIGELASGLGNVVPIAAALGVGFDELVAGTAALTTQGLSTASAITSLRAILSGVAKPTSEAAKLAKKLGIDFSTTGLQSKGLAGFLEDVVDKTGGSADQLSVLFGSVEALNAALSFAGGGGAAFNDILDQMADKAGATDQALSLVDESLDARWGNLLQKLINLGTDFGYVLLSVIVPAAEAVAGILEFTASNADVLAIALGVLATRQIPLLITGLTGLYASLTSIQAQFIAGAIAARGLALAMNLIPFVAVVTGLTLAWRWFTSTGEAAETTAVAIEAVEDNSSALSDTLVGVVQGLQQTEAQLRSISQTQALLEQQRLADELRQALIANGDEFINIILRLDKLKGGISEVDLTLFYDMQDAIKTGTADTERLLDILDVIGTNVPELAPMVAELQNSVRNTEQLGGQVDRVNALMRLLNGEATEADKLMLGIAGTDISGNIGDGANEANRLADELQRAYNNMLNLSAQGISSLRESEIRLENRGDPVATAGALARESFGDITGFDPIMQTALEAQRDEFVANAEATERNRQELLAWQRAQTEAGSATEQQVTQLQKLQQEYSAMSEPVNQAQSAFSALDEALNNGAINNEQFVESLKRIQDAFITTGGTAEQWGKIVNGQTDSVAKQMRDVGENALSNLGDEFISLAVDGEASFGDLAKSIVKDLLKIAWQALVVKPILDSFGGIGGGSGGGISTFIKGLFSANAKGNAFDASGVTAFANGGAFSNTVVSGATPFLFGQGGADLGIMGEAGPEAVMPLTRGADGALGVQMYGGGGRGRQPANNNVQISNVFKIEGAVSEDKIVSQIKAQGEQTKENVRQSVVGWLNQYEQDGTM